MRQALALGAAVVAAAVAAIGAGADDAVPVATGGHVAGEGLVTFGGSTFQLSIGAHGDATYAEGSLKMKVGKDQYRADPVCVVVFDKGALVVGTLRTPVDGFTTLIAQVLDNGHGRNDPPDIALAGLTPDPASLQCHPSALDFTGGSPVTHGNFVVHAD